MKKPEIITLIVTLAVIGVLIFWLEISSGRKVAASEQFSLPEIKIEIKAPKGIVGKWKNDDSSKFIEFFHDNSIMFSNDENQFGGTWTKISENRIKADVTILGTTITTMFEGIEISGNTMNVTIDGSRGILTRVE
jgi:hypothetical protein